MTKSKPKKTPKKKAIKKVIKKTQKINTKPEGKQKYNWGLLRQEFMTSEYLEVTAFFRQEYGKEIEKNGTIGRKTKGWVEEKKKFIQSIYQATIDKIEDEESTANAEFLTTLMQGLRAEGATLDKMARLSVKDKERLWLIFMTINGKPTKVIQNDNRNISVPVSALTEAEQESLKKKLKLNGLM